MPSLNLATVPPTDSAEIMEAGRHPFDHAGRAHVKVRRAKPRNSLLFLAIVKQGTPRAVILT